MSSAALPEWVQPDVVIDGRFAVRSVLASRGTAVVLAAEHLRLRQLVALKFLRPEYTSNHGLTARFLREARAAASLRSEHVVSVTDVGVLPDGAPYLVMEYLDGKSLAERLEESGPLPFPEVVEYTLQALEALAEAHGAGIVHRDLKPDNLVLLSRADEPSCLKVIDFGISKLTGPGVTQTELTKNNSFMGSLLYASPEQIRDSSRVDARSDIWSIGVTMYELLTGHTPFQGHTTAELIWEICGEEPTPLEELQDCVPSQLFSIISRCLEKDPAARFACVQDMARAFHSLARTPASRIAIERIVRRRSSVPPLGRTPSTSPPTCKSSDLPLREEAPGPSKRRVGLVASAAFVLTCLTLFTVVRGSSQLDAAATATAAPRHAAVALANAPPVAPALPASPAPTGANDRALHEIAVASPRPAPVRPPQLTSSAGAKTFGGSEAQAPIPTASLVSDSHGEAKPRAPRVLDPDNPFEH